VVHPHFTTELARAHRAELLRAAQAHRLARPRPAADPVGSGRWIAVLRRALRRPARPVPLEESP
jgi:hypothetical protein